MEATLRLLEERVTQTVERLRALAGERERLEKELRALRARLDELARRGGGGGAEAAGWPARAERIATELRQAVEQLRES